MNLLPHPDSRLHDAYRRVLDRIARAAIRSGRSPRDVTLVAVTKSATLPQIHELLALGHRDLGESRVQQLVSRAQEVREQTPRAPHPSSIRWHLIGHLQRNKVPQAASLVTMIHSVDSIRLADALESHLAGQPDAAPPLDVLMQVNVSGETSKFGVPPDEAMRLAQHIARQPHLRLCGLMTIAPFSDNPQDARPTFSACARLFASLRDQTVAGPRFDTLSMGMSGDFDVAVEQGATLVRIGSALFA